VTVGRSISALAVLVIGIGLGFAVNQVLRPDHFAALSKFAGQPFSVAYQRCLQAKGYGHDLEPLSLQEFCGVWVTSTFLHSRNHVSMLARAESGA
jgi:hypothetical protein